MSWFDAACARSDRVCEAEEAVEVDVEGAADVGLIWPLSLTVSEAVRGGGTRGRVGTGRKMLSILSSILERDVLKSDPAMRI